MKVTVHMTDDDDYVEIYKDDEVIMTFAADGENLGDIYYNVANMLRALGIQVQEQLSS